MKVKSKMSKDFDKKAKMGLRMADGGPVITGNPNANRSRSVDAFVDNAVTGTPTQPAPAAPVATDAAPTAPADPMSPEEISLRQKYGMLPKPQTSMMDKVKGMLHFADGGPVLTQENTPFKTPREIGNDAGFAVDGQSPPQPGPSMRSLPSTQPTARPLPPSAPPVVGFDPLGMFRKVNPGRPNIIGVRGADGGYVGGNYADGGRISLRGAVRHGMVHGPGGPRDDKVPAMLSDGEYVLPAKTVDHVGRDNLDDLVEHTNDGREPNLQGVHEDRNPDRVQYADGGVVGDDFPNLRNPNVNTNYGSPSARLSPEAADYVRSQGAAAPADAGSTVASDVGRAASAGSNLGYKSARVAGAASRFVTPVVAAAPLAGFDDYHINDPGVDSSAMGTLRNIGGRISDAIHGNAMSEDRDVGQEGLRKGAVEAGLDSLSGLAKTGDFAAGVVGAHPDLAGKLDSTVRSDLGSFVSTPQSRAAGGRTNAAPADAPSKPAVSDTTPSGAPPSNSPQPGDVVNGARYNSDGSWSRNLFSPEERAGLRAQQYAPTQYGSDSDPGSVAAHFAMPDSLRSGGGGWNGWFAARNARKVAAQQAELGQRERESQRSAGVALSGQASARNTAALQARLAQFNADRAYNLDATKTFGTGGPGATGAAGGEVGRAEQASRQAAQDAQDKQLGERFRTTDAKGNNVPDMAKVASYKDAAAKTLPSMITELKQNGTPAALQKAQELEKGQVGALTPGDHDMLTDLFNRRERMRDARGIGPNQGTFKESNNLLDYRQLPGDQGVQKRVFGGNRIVTPAGSVSANDLRYRDAPANMFLPDFNKVQSGDLTRGLRTQ